MLVRTSWPTRGLAHHYPTLSFILSVLVLLLSGHWKGRTRHLHILNTLEFVLLGIWLCSLHNIPWSIPCTPVTPDNNPWHTIIMPAPKLPLLPLTPPLLITVMSCTETTLGETWPDPPWVVLFLLSYLCCRLDSSTGVMLWFTPIHFPLCLLGPLSLSMTTHHHSMTFHVLPLACNHAYSSIQCHHIVPFLCLLEHSMPFLLA